jgi:outer membrane protein assembly factor BamB
MLVGSTTSGYVFAIALDSGEELWATWASNTIAGVKGSVAGKDGIVVVATDRCTDRYCYRYRNQTLPTIPGNLFVRGLNAADGALVWSFKTTSPVWNMVPLWGPDGSVFFQDWEGRLYSLDLQTGDQRFQVGGDIGTHTNAAAVYDPGHNVVMALGTLHYSVNNYHMENALGVPVGKYCNPYPAPGILVNCNTWQGSPGFIRGYNASSGREFWEVTTPEPPASASTGMLNSPGMHTRLIVTMGMNCKFNSPSQIWAIDPNTGHIRWQRDGPTLWTMQCAGDKQGADIRRAMGGRAACTPNSWSAPAIDSNGDVFVGSQVGELLKFGVAAGTTPSPNNIALVSTLTTGVAFQDSAIAFGTGVMAVSTCTSLMVFQTMAGFENEAWSVSHSDYSPTPGMVHGDPLAHEISEDAHDTYDPNVPAVAVPWLY